MSMSMSMSMSGNYPTNYRESLMGTCHLDERLQCARSASRGIMSTRDLTCIWKRRHRHLGLCLPTVWKDALSRHYSSLFLTTAASIFSCSECILEKRRASTSAPELSKKLGAGSTGPAWDRRRARVTGPICGLLERTRGFGLPLSICWSFLSPPSSQQAPGGHWSGP